MSPRRDASAQRDAAAARREPLTRQRALTSAVALADAEGLRAVTMRRLAQELGVEAMSLYHHVSSKDDILDGMVDLVFAEVEIPEDTDWRTAMEHRAHSMRSALARHPWALGLMESRKRPGPATLAHHEALLQCLREAGFSLPATAHAAALLDAYIYGFAMQEAQLPFETGEQTQELAADVMAGFPEGAYPYFTEFAIGHVMQPGYDFGDEFDFGLGLILDGLHLQLQR